MPKSQEIQKPILRFLDMVEMKLLTKFGIKWVAQIFEKMGKLGTIFAENAPTQRPILETR